MSSPEVHISFGAVDYALLGIMLLASMAIGLYFAVSGKKQQTKAEYLLGGRRFKPLPVCLSLFASFMSAISLLGIPTEIYTYGTMYMYSLIGIGCSYVVAVFTVVPLMYPLKVTSVYEYLYLRFQSRTVQLLGATFGVLSTLSYMTVALLTPALALETAVGIPLWLSIILVGAVGTVYTTLGGMKSVIWTDVFQTSIIFAGIFTVIIKGSMNVGGAGTVWRINKDSGRIVFDDVSLDPRVRHTVWNMVIAIIGYWVSNHFSQSSVQRLVSTRSEQNARKVYFYTIPLVLVFIFVLCLTGLVMVAYFYEVGCDPLAAGYVSNKNQIVPYFVIKILGFFPGLAGLYIASIFSGALSTLSSGINSLAANTVQDFLPYFLRYKSEFFETTFTKSLVFFFGVTSTGLAYLAKDFKGPVIQFGYTIVSATNGPLLGLFFLGGLFPQANYKGAVAGFLGAIVFSYWQAIGTLKYGYSTATLPMGPTDHCRAVNFTSMLTTPEYSYFTSNTPYSSINVTAASNVTGIHASDRFDLSVRDFSVYDVSYVWAPVTGAIIAIIIALTTSFLTNLFSTKKDRPEAKLLFPFCRRMWYSDRDVVGTDINMSI